MKITITLQKLFVLLLAIVVLTVGRTPVCAASTFTVTRPISIDYAPTTTFTITRSDTLTKETVKYRTVSLSALAGKHFVDKSGTLTFAIGEDTKTVDVSEIDPTTIPLPYTYSSVAIPTYKFELTDEYGHPVAECNRHYLYAGPHQIMSDRFSEKTLGVHTSYIPITVTDAGYAQAYHLVPLDAFFGNNAPAQEYLTHIGAQLRMRVTLSAAEVSDGYQYIQILVNDTTNCDTGAGDGDPGTLSVSHYMAGFSHYHKGKNEDYADYSFPVTSQGSSCGVVEKPWDGNTVGDLRQQYFKYNCRADDGRLIIPTDLTTLCIRLNASGSQNDDWYAKNVKAYIQAIDNSAPTITAGDITVTAGPYYYGSTVAITIPFNEIVKLTDPDATKLVTEWGTFDYYYGNENTILTFRGTITATEKKPLKISAINGTVKDIVGNTFGGISSTLTLSSYTSQGYSLGDFTKIDNNTYAIANKNDLKRLAAYVNVGNNCNGLTFRQTADITDVGSIARVGSSSTKFRGTYDGGGYLLSGLTISSADDKGSGLVGYLDGGVVENVHLASSSISGNQYVAGIVGLIYNGGVVRNCFVESSVYIKGLQTYRDYFGGVAGYINNGTILGCHSAAKFTLKDGAGNVGGIVGNVGTGNVRNCLFTGNSFSASNDYGAILGRANISTANPNITNNYSTRANFRTSGDLDTGTDMAGLRFARTISAGENTTLTPLGNTYVYDVSGITAIGLSENGNYGNSAGCAILHNGNLYSGEGQTVSLSVGCEVPTGNIFKGYTAEGGTLTQVSGNTYSLTMSNTNVTISANLARTGDVNGDTVVDDQDVTDLVDMLLGRTAENDMTDVNGDGDKNVADVTALVNGILNNGN